jgi:glucosyl-3-phosphoglycerate synthase
MADFHQNGSVATLHNLTRMPLEMMEGQLRQFAAMRKITLILPSLFSELGRDALSRIVDELSGATYINHVIIGLDQADAEQYRFARQYFSRLPQKHDILWNDGPRLKAIDKKLEDAGLAPNEPGKGRNVWYCIGYALASQNADVVALHDCDITTYSREMLARLVYPVANPAFPYQTIKATSNLIEMYHNDAMNVTPTGTRKRKLWNCLRPISSPPARSSSKTRWKRRSYRRSSDLAADSAET